MSNNRLNPLSYVVLALIGREGAGAHDLVDMVRRGGRLYWSASPSKIYAEPKRLEEMGYVRSQRAAGKTRQRTLYTLSDSGLAALERWLGEPSHFPRLYNEAVCRVMAGDLVDDAALLAGLQSLKRELADLRANLDEAEAVASTLAHRERYLKLVHALGRRLVDAHEEWLGEVERELAQADLRTSSVASGRAKIRKGTNVVPSPGETCSVTRPAR